MEIRGALKGSGITLAVIGGLFGAQVVANANDAPAAPVVVEEPVAVVKSTPPAPVVTPTPTPEPVVVPEVVVPEPAVEPEPVVEAPAPEPAPVETYAIGPADEGAPYGRSHTGQPMPAPAPDGNSSESFVSQD